MAIKRLLTGSIPLEKHDPEKPVPATLSKKCLLVYEGTFQSLDGEVEIDGEKLQKIHDNHNSLIAQLSRLATGNSSMKYNPPIQLDHSTSAKDTVGRLVGPLELGAYQTEDGEQKKALYGTAMILGKDNVERVMDGRWTHLSIGADLDTGKLSELTITPFPAAPEASMLSKGNIHMAEHKGKKFETRKVSENKYQAFDEQGLAISEICETEAEATAQAKKKIESTVEPNPAKAGDPDQKPVKMAAEQEGGVHIDIKSHNEGEEKEMSQKKELSAEEQEKLWGERCRKHLMDEEKLSAEDADKKLAAMSEDDKAALKAKLGPLEEWAEQEEKEHGLAEGEKEGEKKLSRKDEISRLATDFRSHKATAQLALKKQSIITRLSALKAEGKVTPAEIKKFSKDRLDKLAKENEATIDAVLKTYQDREPVIMPGLVGSTKGSNPADVYKQTRLKSMQAELMVNMPFTAQAIKARMAGEQVAATTQGVQQKPIHEAMAQFEPGAQASPSALTQEHHLAYDAVMKCLEEGKHLEAKEHLKKLWGSLTGGAPAEHLGGDELPTHAQMSALADSVKKMENVLEQVIKLASGETDAEKV